MWKGNIQAYDKHIRSEKSVSYCEHKGGNNGSAIYTVEYKNICSAAQKVIKNVRAGNPPKHHARDGKVHRNDWRDLPRDGEYVEYSAADPGLTDPGAVIVIHDTKHDNFYITLTHYRTFYYKGYKQNSCYRIKAIPFKKIAEGGGPKTIESKDA
jgi:guanyl-specific ribonuclease Sa